jgi:hypothetical protein
MNTTPDQIEEELARIREAYHPREGFESLDDWTFSRWDNIIAAHAAGWPIENRHIAALLRRGKPIPPQAQAFLAEAYFEPLPPKGRGAPKKPDFVKEKEQLEKAEAFVEQVDELRRQPGMTLRTALEEYLRFHPHYSKKESPGRRYASARRFLREYWTNARTTIEGALGLCDQNDPFKGQLAAMREMALAKIAEYS